MNTGITALTQNIGMGLENVILLIVALGSIIFMAIKFEVGAIMGFITTGVLFVILYIGHMDYVPTVVVMFLFLVMMAVSLLSSKDTPTGVMG